MKTLAEKHRRSPEAYTLHSGRFWLMGLRLLRLFERSNECARFLAPHCCARTRIIPGETQESPGDERQGRHDTEHGQRISDEAKCEKLL